MGNDGGSIPTRRELVKEAAKAASTQQIKENRAEALDYAWKTCSLSHKPLKEPIVSDAAGKLYNKDAVVEYLLAQASGKAEEEGKSLENSERELRSNVKSLKDVVEVWFQHEEVEGEVEEKEPRWICPITNKYLGPSVKAVYLVPCGHAFSEVAIKETSSEGQCLRCSKPYESENVVNILPITPSEVERSQARILRLQEQGLSHSLKKAPDKPKKRKKDKTAAAAAATAAELSNNPVPTTTNTISDSASTPPPQPTNKSSQPSTNGIKNIDTASLTARVIAEQDLRNKRRKLDDNENVKSLFSSGTKSGPIQGADFMTRGYSIPAGARR